MSVQNEIVEEWIVRMKILGVDLFRLWQFFEWENMT